MYIFIKLLTNLDVCKMFINKIRYEIKYDYDYLRLHTLYDKPNIYAEMLTLARSHFPIYGILLVLWMNLYEFVF